MSPKHRYSEGMANIEWFDDKQQKWRPCEIVQCYKWARTYKIRVSGRYHRVKEDRLGMKYAFLAQLRAEKLSKNLIKPGDPTLGTPQTAQAQ